MQRALVALATNSGRQWCEPGVIDLMTDPARRGGERQPGPELIDVLAGAAGLQG